MHASLQLEQVRFKQFSCCESSLLYFPFGSRLTHGIIEE
jgi:hypothetical protein